MPKPPLDPEVADTAPSDSVLTVYDEEHVIAYLRLLDADAEGADWREVARIVLHLAPETRLRSRPEDVREPFIARQMDDRAGLLAPATWWRVRLGNAHGFRESGFVQRLRMAMASDTSWRPSIGKTIEPTNSTGSPRPRSALLA